MIIHFLSYNDENYLELCAADISAIERDEGFYTDRGFIPPVFMFDREAEGLEVLHRHAEEIGVSVRSVLN